MHKDTQTIYTKNGLFSKVQMSWLYNTSTKRSNFIHLQNIEDVLLKTMQDIFAQDNLGNCEHIVSALLLPHFMQDKSQSEYFNKCFNNLFDKNSSIDNKFDNLLICFTCILDKIDNEMYNKYDSNGDKIWPTNMKKLISTLKGIYFSDDMNNDKNKIKISKELIPLLKSMLQKSFLTHQYFDFMKVIVGLYNPKSRKKFMLLIKDLFNKCNYNNRKEFLKKIDIKETDTIDDNTCYTIMSMIIQVYITDMIISFNTAFYDLEEDTVKIGQEMTNLSKQFIEIPKFPGGGGFSHNIADAERISQIGQQ